MVKFSSGELKSILRLFGVKGSDISEQHIDQVEVINTGDSHYISFRFDKRKYILVIDDSSDDDIDSLHRIIEAEFGNLQGSFLSNPNVDFLTFGLPFKGKTIYLYLGQIDKKRLDSVLAENNQEISRTTWQKHIKSGKVSVNGSVVLTPKYEVTKQDILSFELPESTNYENQELPIIYIDENVIVIDKPAGVLTHAKGAISEEFTVADFFKRFTEVGLESNRPGIIHRLDRDTSGVMIGARTLSASKLLARQFSDRKTKKTYFAVLSGQLKQKQAIIELPIERDPAVPSTFRVAAGGKTAVTHYKVVKESKEETLVELRPITGRTHQLRIHMKYLGAPIKGDRIYGNQSTRLFLHASSLEITIPDGKRVTFESPLPLEFQEVFNKEN